MVRVFNRKKKVWVELPDEENTPQEVWDMDCAKIKAMFYCDIHDAKPQWLRDIANERGY